MLTALFTAHTHRPADEVFGYLADLAHQPEWRHDIVSSVLDRGGPGEQDPSQPTGEVTDHHADLQLRCRHVG